MRKLFALFVLAASAMAQNIGGGINNPGSSSSITGHTVTNAVFCSSASGSATTYTCATAPSFTPADGDMVDFDADVTNSGAITLNVNGAGAVAVKKWVSGVSAPVNLVANDIQANQPTWLYFDAGLNIWSEMSPTANSSTGPTGTPTNNDILTSNGTTGQVQDPGGCTLTSSAFQCGTGIAVSLTGGVQFGSGTAGFMGFASSKFYQNATRDMRLQQSAVDKFQWLNGPYVLDQTTGVVQFGSSGLASPDLGLSRGSANQLNVGTGAQGNAGGTIQAATINPTTGIVGVNTNSSAPAGDVGELISSQVVKGSAVSLSTGTAANVTSVSLTAGDWNCFGAVDFTFGATTSVTNLAGSISQSTGAMGPQDSGFDSAVAAMIPTAANDSTFPLPVFQELLSATTTVFLVAKATFTVSTTSAYGTITCRRAR